MILLGSFATEGRRGRQPTCDTLVGELLPKGGVYFLQDGGGLPTWFAIVSLRFVTAVSSSFAGTLQFAGRAT